MKRGSLDTKERKMQTTGGNLFVSFQHCRKIFVLVDTFETINSV